MLTKEIRHAVGVLSKVQYSKMELQLGRAADVYGHVPNRYDCQSRKFEDTKTVSFCRFSNMGVNATDGSLQRISQLKDEAYLNLHEGNNIDIFIRTRDVVGLGLDICMAAWVAGCLREKILPEEELATILEEVATPDKSSVGSVMRTEPGCAVNCTYFKVVKRAGLIKE